jgi:hypothetical protein
MGMAADNGVKSGCGRVQVKLVGVVEHIQAEFTDLHHFGIFKVLGPLPPVHVSSNRHQWSQSSQDFEDLRATHIACMNDEFNALESF